MDMEATTSSSLPPGGSPTSKPRMALMAMKTKEAITASIVPDGGQEERQVTLGAVRVEREESNVVPLSKLL
jgi:hypothetical protein